ncbi:hypothetical protein JRQ81_015796, partial [Phrynocephalus forsythii]
MSLIDYEMIAACHVAVTASKQIAIAIHLRRQAWLRTASILDNARNRIEDSPPSLDGEGLFASTMDGALDNLMKMRETVSSYGYQG